MAIKLSGTTGIDMGNTPVSNLANSGATDAVNKVYVDNKTWKDINYKSTPVSITSWSYVGTTITLNVASHDYVAGEYIEVSGTTATTYAPNGVHLVTSVTATTIVFTLGATPTGTTGVSSATVKGYATINGRVSESIGVNQNLVDASASKVDGSTYYNTSGRPKFVIITATVYNGGWITLVHNGITAIIRAGASNSQIGTFYWTVFAIVPDKASYTYSGQHVVWYELG